MYGLRQTLAWPMNDDCVTLDRDARSCESARGARRVQVICTGVAHVPLPCQFPGQIISSGSMCLAFRLRTAVTTAWPHGTLWTLILGVGRPPGETTICEFDHRIEEQGLGKVVLAAANDHLKAIKWSARL